MKYINEYEHNEEVVKEHLNVILSQKVNRTNFINIAFCLIMLILFISTQNKATIIYIVVITIITLITHINKRIVINKEMKKVKEKNISYMTNITIDTQTNSLIWDYSKKLDLIHLVSVSQNKNWIILTVKGGQVLLLKKDSFLDGIPEECYTFLKEKIKINKRSQSK